ncbi:hypothetical protein U0070_008373 [Myodes glareolus]|uniref:Uncharacterized protein n=1 Tax=Myodes glareolus TaxID=447135 RepID=A0AAW0IXF8_MYOGA
MSYNHVGESLNSMGVEVKGRSTWSYHPPHVSTASSPKTAFFGAKPTPLRLILSHAAEQTANAFSPNDNHMADRKAIHSPALAVPRIYRGSCALQKASSQTRKYGGIQSKATVQLSHLEEETNGDFNWAEKLTGSVR